VAQDHQAFLELLHWEGIAERDETHPWPGSLSHPQVAYAQALLIKVREGFRYTTKLREFLVKHLPLVLLLGFRPQVDPSQPYGFDVEKTVPGARHFRRKLQTFPNAVLQTVLEGTVQALQTAIPELGESVAMDVKHIYAWVKENTPRQLVKERFNPQRQPTGDPDCKPGVKRSRHQDQPPEPAALERRSEKAPDQSAKRETKEFLWGYGTGIAVARHPRHGEFVLAERTQTFNRHDSTYYFPWMDQTRARIPGKVRRFSALAPAMQDAGYLQFVAATGKVLTDRLAGRFVHSAMPLKRKSPHSHQRRN
jgi:hypothetical protein